jgi:hypothetical protein
VAPLTRDASQELADLQQHDDLIARIYTDHLPDDVRGLALALARTGLRHPARHTRPPAAAAPARPACSGATSSAAGGTSWPSPPTHRATNPAASTSCTPA